MRRLEAFKRQKILPVDRQVDVLGVRVDDISEKSAISKILQLARDEKGYHLVVTVNSEIVMLARRNPEFSQILKNADLCLADGAGVVWAKLIFGGKIHERLAGVDLVQKLCQRSAKKTIGVGFLGGFGDVANMVSERQKLQNPGLKVVFAGPNEEVIGQQLKLKGQNFQKVRVDLLFVAYGMGRQEFWIAKNKNRLNCGVAIGVGGAFDYLAGVKKRAPIFVQKWGMEWLWRLVMEPWRFWRMRVLPVFLVLVLAKKLTKSP
ncbi:WecB/TagA/CpsF family glycosyltransferase [Candidatus Curtissbacteria bacterium]|nr:WecB/TagA/CpsF family glycosyltransferase [Candidatus Curtissbacteria bacterium]